jgi:hypothetical protein
LAECVFLRALAGTGQTLGVAGYYAPSDDERAEGRHSECRDKPAQQLLGAQIHAGLSALSEAESQHLKTRKSC